LIGEAVRDLRQAGRVAVSAVVLITLSLAALGGFWLLSLNLERAVARWRERVRVIVYLKREPAPSEAKALVERVREVPGVAGVLYISKTDALMSLKQLLGKDASVVAQLPANPLPASLEVTPVAAPRLEPLVNITLDLPQLAFLSPMNVLALVLAGALLGGLGGWLARAKA